MSNYLQFIIGVTCLWIIIVLGVIAENIEVIAGKL